MRPQYPRLFTTSFRARRRILCLTFVAVSLLLQGEKCPPDGEDNDSATSADFGEAILIEPNPVVVSQGSQVSVGLDFRSRRPDLFFIDYRVNDVPAGMDTSFDETRQTSATPLLADLEIAANGVSAGIHRLRLAGGQISDEVEATLLVVVTPRDAIDLPGATAIAGGEFHTLAIAGDGQVFAWGHNDQGQLGDGTLVDRVQPVPVVGLPGRAIAIAGGGAHSIALLEDGTVWSWGANDFEQLGARSEVRGLARSVVPERLACHDFRCEGEEAAIPIPRFVAVAAGANHSLALGDNGVIWAWGRSGRGQLGRETNERPTGIPFPIGFPNDLSGVVRFVAIAAGDEFSLAVEDDGRVWGWGENTSGQLGDGFEREYAFPIELFGQGPGSAVAVAAGNSHSMILTPEGTVLTAGSNISGQLGRPLQTPEGFLPVPQVREVIEIAAGVRHSIALHADGTGSTWGLNEFDQLGFPERAPPNFEPNPSSVQGVPLLRRIAAGGRHSLGLSRDCPQIWGWGDNSVGQLGLGHAGRNGFAGRTLAIGDRSTGAGLGDCGLPLAVALSGEGSVSSSPGQIDCPAELCSEIYDRGERVTLTATANPAQRFLGWAGDVTSTSTSVDVDVDDSRSVVARFETIRQPPIPDFTITPSEPVTSDRVRFDAVPSSDPDGEILLYSWDSPDLPFIHSEEPIFEHVFGLPQTGNIRLTVTDDQGLVASITRTVVIAPAPPGGGGGGSGGGGGGGGGESFQLQIVFQGPGSGRVTLDEDVDSCTDTCSISVAAGETVDLLGLQDDGSFFSHFTGCEDIPGNPFNLCVITMDMDRSITVFFE